MREPKTPVPAAIRLNSRRAVEDQFANLPIKFKGGAVGTIYQKIIQSLDQHGEAPLATLLEALFPDQNPDLARRSLATGYANRPYRSETGQTPLRLRLPTLAQIKAEDHGAGAGAKVWFESEVDYSLKGETRNAGKHTAQEFDGGMAARATQSELEAAKREAFLEPSFTSNPPSDVFRQSQVEVATHGDMLRHSAGGLRSQVKPEEFQPGLAQQRSGFDTNDDMEALGKEVQAARNKTPKIIGTQVICLDAMLIWATACQSARRKTTYIGPPAHRLLAMLGDYGTGKTSHCLQFARVLNGDVDHSSWTAWQKDAQTRGLELPQALYIDLASLAGASRLAELTLEELLHLALKLDHGIASGNLRAIVSETGIYSLIQRAQLGQLIFVFDGLDELLKNERSVLQQVFAQLLKVLEPSPFQSSKGQTSLARVVVSCRTHYFRDVEQQHAFFNTRRRGNAQAGDFLSLTMLPWKADTIAAYLAKRLSPHDAATLQNIIQTTYNLEELASRPVLLAMMSEQVGELLRLREATPAGEPITAARLYGITVSEWVQRDNGKHRLAPHHKALLMGALAAAMWSDGQEAWSAERLDRWLLPTVDKLFPKRYDLNLAEAIQDDLRTATFIVRPDASRFSFAHRSFLEYFLARFIWDALELCSERALTDADLLALLPSRGLNAEAQQFLKEICITQLRRLGTDAMRQRVLPLIRSLQDPPSQPIARTSLPAERLVATPVERPAAQRANLWHLVMDFEFTGEHTQVGMMADKLAWFDAESMARPLNLRGLDFSGQQWQKKDFSWLPPLDVRGTKLRNLRAHEFRFGRVLCDSATDWSQALLRYCDTSGFQWGESSREGLIVRKRSIARNQPLNGPRVPSLDGPWTAPKAHFPEFTCATFHPHENLVLTGGGDRTVRLWNAATGKQLRSFGADQNRPRSKITGLAFHPLGHQVLAGDESGVARLWEVATGEELKLFGCEYELFGDQVCHVAFHPKGDMALTGMTGNAACLWDTATGEELRQIGATKIKTSGARFWSFAFHPEGHQIVTGGIDRHDSARLWETDSGKELQRFGIAGDGHLGFVNAVAFHPRGHQLLTGGGDGEVYLWDVESGQKLRSFGKNEKAHSGPVRDVAFHPRANLVLTCGGDARIYLWDSTTGREVRRFSGKHKGHVSQTLCLAFHPKGGEFVTGGSDGTARVWSGIDDPNQAYKSCRLLVHGDHAPSTAEFDADGNLLSWDDEAVDTWLFTLANGKPEPIEMHPDWAALAK